MYEGEVFTFRNDRTPRTVATNRQQRPAAPDHGRTGRRDAGRSGGPVPDDRAARLENRVDQLEETLAHLSGLVQHLTQALQALEDVEPARTKASPARVRHDLPQEAPRVTVQMQAVQPEDAAPMPGDVKVSLYAGSSTEAILGHVKVTHQ